MAENATKRLPCTPTTKKRIDEQKDEKESYDLWLRKAALGDDV